MFVIIAKIIKQLKIWDCNEIPPNGYLRLGGGDGRAWMRLDKIDVDRKEMHQNAARIRKQNHGEILKFIPGQLKLCSPERIELKQSKSVSILDYDQIKLLLDDL